MLGDTAQKVQSAGVTHAHDLTGRIFQRLIADRKYLATFYTRPESAALLARLAVAKLEGVDWLTPKPSASSASATSPVAPAPSSPPFTNRWLPATSAPVATWPPCTRDDGGGPLRLRCHALRRPYHQRHPLRRPADVTFNKSRIYTMPYGRQSDGTVSIGSLELLQPSQVLTLFNTNDPALRTAASVRRPPPR